MQEKGDTLVDDDFEDQLANELKNPFIINNINNSASKKNYKAMNVKARNVIVDDKPTANRGSRPSDDNSIILLNNMQQAGN